MSCSVLPTYFLALTPFSLVFAGGLLQSVMIDVLSAQANHTAASSCYGPLRRAYSTGQMATCNAQPNTTMRTCESIDANDVSVTVNAQRQIYIESVMVSSFPLPSF
ncbi:hypothetical protein EDC04DRAFT_2646342 [Pisolithus marmoratus]|nr:hypothetical protein EDC04DRAFT_2646342 [Pisolithus marmoratus]